MSQLANRHPCFSGAILELVAFGLELSMLCFQLSLVFRKLGHVGDLNLGKDDRITRDLNRHRRARNGQVPAQLVGNVRRDLQRGLGHVAVQRLVDDAS
ncbi:MAG TPA: hypothetical protein VFV72_02750 [Candidatus Limnocylindrales bacterium]|nr:hypothetical protein [Candidatus Limnocylindrales bacterium]